jgi:glutamyl-tRNA reductase
VELIEKILGEDLGRRSIMVIGAGQMAECSLRLLVKKGARWILVANRSSDRAIDLAIQYGAQAICLGDCLFEMPDVDVVIAATSSAETLLYRDDVERLMEARRHRPLLLIDLAVPRNIDPAVRGLAHVALYNIDDLEAVARRGVQARERELAACHQIIEAHVAALIEKLNAEDERLSAEEQNNRWVPNAFATPSNRLPTAA